MPESNDCRMKSRLICTRPLPMSVVSPSVLTAISTLLVSVSAFSFAK